MLRAKRKASPKRRLFYGASAATLERAMPPTPILVSRDRDGNVTGWTTATPVMTGEESLDVVHVGAP